MNINRIQGYGTNFKSTVLISNYISAYGSEKQRKVLSDEKVQQELNKLKNNGKDDIVYLFAYTNLCPDEIAMQITEKSRDCVKVGSPFGCIRSAEDIEKLYKEGKEILKESNGKILPDGLSDFIIV